MAEDTVERFLASPGAAVPLDDDGFLDGGFLEVILSSKDRPSAIRSWAELECLPCVVVLGEPGSGKTMEFKKACARLPSPALIELGEFSTPEHLERGLSFKERLKSAPEGDVHVFLDGLDECLLQIDTATRILLKQLKGIALRPCSLGRVGRLALRFRPSHRASGRGGCA